ncbi:geranylgeranyl diphosphate reductase [Oceanibaculum indicum]|uniref:Geranylgeranyl reductase n=1 Tax=Oceanibaculum indicum P24 TaxID=1207063 RepID=K2JL30_9PROT|nr:geranylgeranyl diphosphate reductase [Oceanibaculum indicum]EKE76038.1 geranylgeranyl reductase [Oceanibaculum indicum P24]
METLYDVAVIGGGPSGATAAEQLARAGYRVALVDPADRIKPCGGAIPSRALKDFSIPESQLVSRAHGARIIAPSGRSVDMQIGDRGFVGMVDRATFDPWLRARAARAGAEPVTGRLIGLAEEADGCMAVVVRPSRSSPGATDLDLILRARLVIGADGANSAVRRLAFPAAKKPRYVFAYHEIVETPVSETPAGFHPARCDVVYDGRISPDFYGWVFPHGPYSSVGTGTAVKGHDLRQATAALRRASGLEGCRTVRREGAPLPLKAMRRWDNGRNILLIGDAAGTVAPSSGEGIYYAMLCGQLAADAVVDCLASGQAAPLKQVRRRFMREHGRVFLILGIMQSVWYRNDRLREKFVTMCADPDIQRLTWESYLDKKLTRRDPLAHIRIFFKDLAQLLGIPAAQK